MDHAERDRAGLRRGDLLVRVRIDGAECWFDAADPRDICIFAERFLRHLESRACRPTIVVESQDPLVRSRVREYIDGILLETFGCASP